MKRTLPMWMSKSGQNSAIQQTMPKLSLPSTCQLVYSHNWIDCSTLCDELISTLTPSSVIGFDIEWPAVFTKGTVAKTATVQICPHAKQCFVFQISQMNSLPVPLKRIIESTEIKKTGVNIKGDLWKLHTDFNVFPDHTTIPESFIDLSEFASKTINSSEKWSLARFCQRFLNFDLAKTKKIRLGNWANFPLSEEQLHYAALDAYASFLVYEAILNWSPSL